MVTSKNARDIVLFLGAGFSHDAALPIMSRFGGASDLELKALKERHGSGSRSPREAAQILIEAGETFAAFQRYCAHANILDDDQLNNLETIFCIAEVMAEAGPHVLTLNGRQMSVPELSRHIQLWLWKIYQACPPLDHTRSLGNGAVYDKLFTILKNLGIGSKLTVLSTNYDLVFERWAMTHWTPCAYPLRRVIRVQVGDGGNNYLDDPSNREAPLVCKLHGSINYFYHPARVDRLLLVDDAGSTTPIRGSGLVPTDRPTLFAVDSISELQKDHGKDITPAIIPPTYAKLTGYPWLREIWHQAFEALCAARAIVFIGYSMPASDGFMRALIHAALASRTGADGPKVVVVDPDDDTRCRYMKTFQDLYVTTKARRLQDLDREEIERILT